MTIKFEENWDSGRIGLYDADFVGNLYGTDDYLTALQEAVSFIPSTFDTGLNVLTLKNVGKIERIAEEIWKVPFEYGSAQSAQQNENEFASEGAFNQQFEIGGQTARVTHSKATIASYVPDGETATDFGGGINATDSGVDGIDIPIPSFGFSETRNFQASQLPALRAALFGLCCKTNSAPFLGFAAGEVLYLAASGGLKGSNTFGEVTHKFIASPNVTGLSIGGITGINKKGHEYLWVRSKEELDVSSNAIRLKPVQVNVERVFDAADLNNIPNITEYGY